MARLRGTRRNELTDAAEDAAAAEKGACEARMSASFFPKKYASWVGILAAFLLMGFFASDYIGFNPIAAALDFPGGFIWFLQEFAPNEKSLEQLPRIANALFTTILDAIAAGTLAAILAYILAVLGSRVTGFGGPVQMVIRAFATILRNIPTVAWGFILLYSFKQAEFTGYLALFFKSLGFLTRTFMETIDEVDQKPIEALRAAGATRFQIIAQGVVPLTLPQITSWVLYMCETNFRDATLVGMLTGTGIGFVFNWYYRTFKYPIAGLVIICIAVAVILVESASNFVRRRVDLQSDHAGEMRTRRSGRIQLKVMGKSDCILLAFALFLVIVTAFTFFQMDYGKVDVAKAAENFLKYFVIMFSSPHLAHFTAEEMIGAMGVTIGIAVLTTLGGMAIALALSLLAACNLSSKRVSNVIKTLMALIRSVPTIIWVLVFTVAIGLGSEAAVVGMMFHTVSFLTKAFSEAFEETDQGVLDALRSTGATWGQVVTRGVMPDKLNEILSWTFIRFENNFVGAVTVGAIAGSGGIGYQLYMVANYMFDWHEMGLIIYMCLAVSITLEVIATYLRKRFIVHR
ncbi:ABC transporter permease [Adlercreutzia sp. ZJ473]|uniref:PhnE/PtxC family ABC transporter permease n=1 Tax=Adlercreutzia sp. ZJ473 TaxID=2722822 RepID=UPI001555B0C1|nr:ABC transporter permease subunit [Adlercreutzia sp. ZJ473]